SPAAPGRRGESRTARRRRAPRDECASLYLRRKRVQMACHGLDTRDCPVINHSVRGLAAIFVLFASATAVARPRVQVAPFSVHGEALGYFGPEVARAVEAALEGAGVETGAGAEATLTGIV